MSGDPTRLADDPAFRAESGCDLRDEPAALSKPRQAVLRERLVRAASAPKFGSRWSWGIGGATSVLLVWMMTERPGNPPAIPALEPVARPAKFDAIAQQYPAPAAPTAALAEPPGGPPAATVGKGESALPTRRDAAAAPLPVRGETVGPPTVPEVESAVVLLPNAPAGGDLAQQLAAFDSADELFARADHAGALEAYDVYLRTWPGGHFRAEAALGVLRTTASLGNAAGAERLALELASDPALSTRRVEILTLRSRSLAQLGRCVEARETARSLPGGIHAALGTACR